MNVTVHSTRESWLAARRRKVTSSDIPGLLGCYPSKQAREHKNPFALWLKKTGQEAEDDPAMALRFDIGRIVEPRIAQEVERREGIVLIDLGDYTTVSDGLLMATPDRLAYEERALFPLPEGKRAWTGPMTAHEEGWTPAEKCAAALAGAVAAAEFKSDATVHEAGRWKDEKLDYAVVQLHVALAVCGLPKGLVAALFGLGLDFQIYPVERSDELISLIRERAEEFMEAVLTGNPPSAKFIDDSEAVGKSLRAIYSKDTGEEVELGDEWPAKILRHEEIAEQMKALKAEQQKIKNEAMAALRDATMGVAPGAGKAWKWAVEEKKAYSVAASETRVLRLVNAP